MTHPLALRRPARCSPPADPPARVARSGAGGSDLFGFRGFGWPGRRRSSRARRTVRLGRAPRRGRLGQIGRKQARPGGERLAGGRPAGRPRPGPAGVAGSGASRPPGAAAGSARTAGRARRPARRHCGLRSLRARARGGASQARRSPVSGPPAWPPRRSGRWPRPGESVSRAAGPRRGPPRPSQGGRRSCAVAKPRPGVSPARAAASDGLRQSGTNQRAAGAISPRARIRS